MNGIHNPLWLAAAAGRTQEVLGLIEQGAYVDAHEDAIDAAPTPLWAAFNNKRLDTARVLIEAGADIESIGPGGTTPVLFFSNTSRIVQMLIEAGADMYAKDIDGNTLVHHAARFDAQETILKLFTSGVNLAQRNNNGNTALHAAAANDKADMILTLVDLHVDINVTNNLGSTPLYAAAKFGNISAVGTLLYRGATINVNNARGMTAMQGAHKNKHSFVVDMIKRENVRRERLLQPRLLAFAMGGHERLGQESLVDSMDPDVARLVLGFTGV